MSRSKSEQWAQAEAWRHLWPVLQELGVDERCPDMSGCRAAITFVRGLAAERDEARAENEELTAERDGLVVRLNNYTGLGSQIFADIFAVVEQALGRPIEPGHTAAYAAELLAEELARAQAERDKWKTESERLQIVAGMFAESSIRGHQAICDGWWYLWEFGSANGQERSRDKAVAAVRRAAGLEDSVVVTDDNEVTL